MGFYRSIPTSLMDYESYTYLINGVRSEGSAANLRSLGYDTANFNEKVIIGNNIVSCPNALYGCTNFNNEIIIGENVKNCAYLLASCSNFNRSIDIPANVENMYGMFYYTSLNLIPNIHPNVKNWSGLYENTSKFNQSVIISDNVTNISRILTAALNFNHDITIPKNVENASMMLSKAYNFNSNINIDIDNTSLYSLNYFLSNCYKFNQPLNLPTMCNYSYALNTCTNFNSPINFINGGKQIDKVDLTGMFNGCTNFNQPINLTNYDKNLVNVIELNDFLVNCSNFSQQVILDPLPMRYNTKRMFVGTMLNNTCVIHTNNVTPIYSDCMCNMYIYDASYMFDNCKFISGSSVNYYTCQMIENAYSMFRNTNIQTVSNLPNCIIDASYMFANCNDLIYATFQTTYMQGHDNTSIKASNMFEGCRNLKNAHFHHYINDASFMFRGCINLTNVQYINYYSSTRLYSKLENAYGMFYSCSNLLNVFANDSNSDTLHFYNLKNARSMFYGCSNLSTVYGHRILNELTDAGSMFQSCSNYRGSGAYINAPKLIYADQMFAYSNYNISYLNQNFFNLMPRVQNVHSMFRGLRSPSNNSYANMHYRNIQLHLPDSVIDARYFLWETYNISGDVYIRNNNIDNTRLTYLIDLSYRNNNSPAIAVHCTNLSKINGTTASNSVVGRAITWTRNTQYSGLWYYNTTYNVWITTSMIPV